LANGYWYTANGCIGNVNILHTIYRNVLNSII